MQEAIRARALATLENDERQYKPSTRRKIMTGVVAVVTVVLLVLAIDFGVRIIQRILTLWMEEESSVPAPTTSDPDQPFYITVDPPADTPKANAVSAGESGSAASGMTAE